MKTKVFSEISTKEIYSSVLIGKSTFYNHYVDKYDLLSQIISDEVNVFEDLLQKRVDQITNTDLLIELYESLYEKKEAFLTLCSNQNDGIDFKQILTVKLSQFASLKINEKAFPVPNDFVTDLYASSALQAIIWSLKANQPETIATFMNKVMLAVYKIHS
ncbi:hypothetical protein [Fructobacillus fructosus]|uniref:hypothetical protein n=1 Tax=Fructobacillus fructosus TaxID=1631 RepID=UPI0030C88DF2